MVGAAKVNFGWKLGPFIMASVNQSPARNKKTTTALVVTSGIVKKNHRSTALLKLVAYWFIVIFISHFSLLVLI